MNSFKCVNCGLVNWSSVAACKRCGATASALNFAVAPEQSYGQRVANSPAFQPPPTNFSPPPPNLYGAEYGQAFGNSAPQFHNFRRPTVNSAELEAAEADIRKA